MTRTSIVDAGPVEWLTVAEAAKHVKAKSPDAFRKWLARHPRCPRGRYGADLRLDRVQLDAYLRGLLAARGERQPRRGRKAQVAIHPVPSVEGGR